MSCLLFLYALQTVSHSFSTVILQIDFVLWSFWNIFWYFWIRVKRINQKYRRHSDKYVATLAVTFQDLRFFLILEIKFLSLEYKNTRRAFLHQIKNPSSSPAFFSQLLLNSCLWKACKKDIKALPRCLSPVPCIISRHNFCLSLFASNHLSLYAPWIFEILTSWSALHLAAEFP